MIQKVTITEVYKNDTKKDGTKYVISKGTNAGKNFIRIGIKTDKTGDDVYYNNALETDKANNIAKDQSLLLNFTETKSADGTNVWKNFNFPTKEQLAEFAASMAQRNRYLGS